MFDLFTVLTTLHDAAAAKISGTAKNLTPLNAEAVAFATGTIGPALHIPPEILTIAKGNVGAIDKAVEPAEIAALQFLQTRLYSLFSHL